ncbi:MAG: deoxyribodipyrimidine photo-lyase [Acidobacteriota bacterium]|jgi:deoxyribodipyrimidine photo-lyase|nr:deoxyribodipyrimidine photo-lyase [Acidobacteriota bacterium]
MSSPSLVWFRLDLRLADNPALAAASMEKGGLLPVFIWAPEEDGDWPPGAASRWWLHQSLKALSTDLKRHGIPLILRRGPSLEALRSLIRESGAKAVFWNRRYEPALRKRDAEVETALRADGIRIETFNSALLFEPEEIKNSAGKPFQVFTPFWRSCLSAAPDFQPKPGPILSRNKPLPSLDLEELRLEPAIDWAAGLRSAWQPGEANAQKLLRRFVAQAMEDYPEQRDLPAVCGTSRLSPYLHFGEISPRRVWAECAKRRHAASQAFIRQLGWREFAHHLLYHYPHTAAEPLREPFARFPWRNDARALHAWHRGRTGFPIVDAGMRELWATGWMHNRVRMISGSFLVKDLLLPWLEGARWFWDTLVDADLANNTLGWQWVAGCGADAAPYFRIFNPASQARKFDPKQDYVRRWISEFGESGYPTPIVDHARARERALRGLAAIKGH